MVFIFNTFGFYRPCNRCDLFCTLRPDSFWSGKGWQACAAEGNRAACPDRSGICRDSKGSYTSSCKYFYCNQVPQQAAPFFDDPFFRRFFGDEFREFEPRKRPGLASGVIVSVDGYIVTNNHVVSNAEQIKVLLSDKREFKAKLIGADPKTEIAVIKIDANDLPIIVWSDSDKLQVGEFAIAVGNPFGLNQTVTMGIISAVGRANVGVAEYEDFIQTDAAINPGNSGGALVNIRGELIGVNTAIFSQSGGYQGIGFAVPSNMVKAVMESLIKSGKVVRGGLVSLFSQLPLSLHSNLDLRMLRARL